METPMSALEFYEKHCVIVGSSGKAVKPTLHDADRAFFEMVDKAKKEGKQIMIARKRHRPY